MCILYVDKQRIIGDDKFIDDASNYLNNRWQDSHCILGINQ